MSNKIVCLDNKIKKIICDNFDSICMVILVIVSIIIRIIMFDFVSIDAKVYLLPWYNEIVEKGRIGALKDQIGNYNLTYQFMIVLLSYIPIKPLYAYKFLSCLFDYILGYSAGRIVYDLTGSKTKKLISYIFVIFSPIVMINSACWGQCDSIYTSFCVLTIAAVLEEKNLSPFVFYGLALAFKLQAIFMLPFLIILWWKSKKYTIAHFFAIPLTMVFICLPNIIIGHRNIKEIVGIYLGQTGEHEVIAANYPSFWNILVTEVDSDLFHLLKNVAILFTLLALILIVAYVEKNYSEFTGEVTIYLAMITVYTCVLFLPAMHERYGFLYEILAIIILFIMPDSIKAMIPMYIITLLNYSVFLFGHDTITQYSFVYSIVNIYIYLYYMKMIVKRMTAVKKNTLL